MASETKPKPAELCPSQREMVESGGRFCQLLGLPRSVGQIFGLLYVSVHPLSLDDLSLLLGMSKASASIGTRQLHGWGAIRQVWVPGDRRDYYEVVGDISILLRGFITDFLRPRIENSRKQIENLLAQLDLDFAGGLITDEEFEVYSDRIRHLGRLQKKVHRIAPVAQRMI